MTHRPTQNHRALAAFTLIEILIAITILAIGLLGLGAVFPVVIREQRVAIDQMEAPAASTHAESVLRSHRVLGAPDPTQAAAPGDPGHDDRTRWIRFIEDLSPPSNIGFFLFEPENVSGISPSDPFQVVNNWLVDGDLEFDWGGPDPIALPLAQRLMPAPEVSGANPQFVWDIALYRPIPTMPPDPPDPAELDTLQAVVFVRPIDRNIRVPKRSRDNDPTLGPITLADVLLERFGVTPDERRLPVAVNASTGQPAGNGDGEYAPILPVALNAIKMFGFALERDVADVLVLELDQHGSWPDRQADLIARTGQRVVVWNEISRRLTVHEVTGTPTNDVALSMNEVAVRIRPPLPVAEPSAGQSFGGYLQALYSPIPPVDVRIVDLEVSR